MDITLKLPAELIERAQAAGILSDEQIASLIEAELDRRQRREMLFADIDMLRNLEPKLSQEEIEAELKAFRQERIVDRHDDN